MVDLSFDTEKDTIINDDDKYQQISVKTMNPVSRLRLLQSIRVIKYEMCKNKIFYFMHRTDPMNRERAKAVLVDFCNTN